MPITNEVFPATVENMKRAEAGTVALDVESGETCSATPGDYFWLPRGQALTNEAGDELILVVPVSGFRDAELGDV